MNQLTPVADTALANAYHLLASTRAETLWLANFTSANTRETFITQAYENGVQSEAIQRTVGHASITTTESYNQSAKRLRKSASLGERY